MTVEIIINAININDQTSFFWQEHCCTWWCKEFLGSSLEGSGLHFPVHLSGMVTPQPCALAAIVLWAEEEDFHNCLATAHVWPRRLTGCWDPPSSQWLLCLLNCLPALKMLFQHLPFGWSQKYQVQREQCCCESCWKRFIFLLLEKETNSLITAPHYYLFRSSPFQLRANCLFNSCAVWIVNEIPDFLIWTCQNI